VTGTPTWAVVVTGLCLGLVAIVIARWVAASARRAAGDREVGRASGSAELEFILGPLEGHVVSLTAEVTTLGSVAGNTIVLADVAVARKHAAIRRDSMGYELADLGSTNGVVINGQRTAKRLLAAGDIIRIGASEMVFRMEKVG
jgi:hypothetical protein